MTQRVVRFLGFVGETLENVERQAVARLVEAIGLNEIMTSKVTAERMFRGGAHMIKFVVEDAAPSSASVDDDSSERLFAHNLCATMVADPEAVAP